MIRPLLATVVFAAILPATRAADKGELDADQTLFTVMAALDAAGFGDDVSNAANHPLRKAARDYLKNKNLESVGELKAFFAAHKKPDAGANLAQYVSYALSIDGAPDFKLRYAMNELAPDVSPLTELSELLAKFHKEANIDEMWDKSQPAINEVLAAYHEPVVNAVQQSNAYLRVPSGYLGRRFQIYIELLAPPNQVHTRSFKDDYYVVLTPAQETPRDEIRHAYLHYVLDPLVLKFAEAMTHVRSLADITEFAYALPDAYKSDFTLLATECLIKAVEARLLPAGKRQAVVDQALVEGFVLTPAFFDGLAMYEKQEQAMRLYFPDMVKSVVIDKEEKRLANVRFVRQLSSKTVKTVAPPEVKVELTPGQKALAAAEDLYKQRKLTPAKESYSRVLQLTPDRVVHARAYYGLARIAVLESDPETAMKLFERTLELNPDADTRGWSLVYVGRLLEAQGERAQAVARYKAALAVEGVTPGARQAAEKGLQQSFR